MASYSEWVKAYPVDMIVPPAPVANGGWFTGNPAPAGAPWATVPVIPDGSYMNRYVLASANPPPGALSQFPGNRPGNSWAPIYPNGCEPYNFSK